MSSFDTEYIGEIPCGAEIFVIRNSWEKTWIEVHWEDSVIVLPTDQAPRLMILLSVAHEKATGEQWARPIPLKNWTLTG